MVPDRKKPGVAYWAIAVTRVIEDHLSEAEILVEDSDCPIAEGDLLVE